MCSYEAAAVAVISAASTAADIHQQREQQKAAADHQKRVSDANAKLISEQAVQTSTAITSQGIQEKQALSQQLQEVAKRSRGARGTAAATAAQTNTQGQSVEALNIEYSRQELQAYQNLLLNDEFRDEQRRADQERARLGEKVARLNNLPDPYTLPSFLGAALRITESGVSAYDTVDPIGK